MRALKVIGNCCLVFLAIISVCVSLAYLYVHFFDNTITTGTNYIDNQTPVDLVEKEEDLTQDQIDYYEDRYLFNVNYYSNDKNNGIELQEMQLNYFTDPSLNIASARSTGMQYLGDFETYTTYVNNEEEANSHIVPDFYYYDTTDMISWEGGKVGTQLNRNTLLTIKIGDKPFLIQLTGKTDHYSSFLWWDWVSSTTYYDYGDVFYDVLNAVKSNSAGYGDYYITLDLSNYFTVYEYNPSTKNWSADNVSDKVFTYAICKFHYDENGAIKAEQSLYKQIAVNRNYGVKEQVDTTYWQERIVYCLKDNNFDFRYSDTYKGYFVSLKMDTKKLFEEMPRAKVNVLIDLESSYFQDNNINIVGIDYNGFEDVEIDTLTIKGNEQTFYILDNSLHNSNLQTLEHSANIILDISENAINGEYVEVEL